MGQGRIAQAHTGPGRTGPGCQAARDLTVPVPSARIASPDRPTPARPGRALGPARRIRAGPRLDRRGGFPDRTGNRPGRTGQRRGKAGRAARRDRLARHPDRTAQRQGRTVRRQDRIARRRDHTAPRQDRTGRSPGRTAPRPGRTGPGRTGSARTAFDPLDPGPPDPGQGPGPVALAPDARCRPAALGLAGQGQSARIQGGRPSTGRTRAGRPRDSDPGRDVPERAGPLGSEGRRDGRANRRRDRIRTQGQAGRLTATDPCRQHPGRPARDRRTARIATSSAGREGEPGGRLEESADRCCRKANPVSGGDGSGLPAWGGFRLGAAGYGQRPAAPPPGASTGGCTRSGPAGRRAAAGAGIPRAAACCVRGVCGEGRRGCPSAGADLRCRHGSRDRPRRRPRPGTRRPGNRRRPGTRHPRPGLACPGRVRCPDDSPGTSWTLTYSACAPWPTAAHIESPLTGIPNQSAALAPITSVGAPRRADRCSRTIALIRS